ncbi:MAG: FAD:protein FMN transferase [marine benthic group bacterium]|nr:FAD:protein FMN transferase [Candidatus Benthicola marisminoris]
MTRPREDDPGTTAALLELGFEPARPTPEHLEDTLLPSGDHKLVMDRRAMSTRVSVAAIHPSRHLLEDAAGRAFGEMDRLIGLLNRFDSASAVGVLNSEGRIRGAPPELTALLDRSSAVHTATGGAFDITVQPIVDLLHRTAEEDGGAPDEASWREALERVDAASVHVAGSDVRLDRDGMGVTLDGIAKGFIVDAMAAVLEAHGIERFLIDAGGDIRASGEREDGSGWQVAIRDPRDGTVLPAALVMSGGAVATSGGYEARYDPEGSWHHIVSSRTGRSPGDLLSVTVTGPNVYAADALATAALLMSPREGARFIDSLPGFECMAIDAEGRLVLSAGWNGLTVTSQEEGVR